MHTVAMRQTRHTVAVLTVLVLVAASCNGSGGNDDGIGASVDSNAVQPSTGGEPGLVDKPDVADSAPESADALSDDGGNDTLTPDAAATTDSPVVTTVLLIVPETGVPRIDSANLFCRSWSEFAGTFQALALASTFSSDDLAASRAELVASGAIIAAVAGLGKHLPAELESERSNLIVNLAGPMERRALRNYSGLEAAELSSEQIDELADLWLAALASAGVDEPNIQLDIPEDVALRVDGVAGALRSSVPLIHEDPSLVTDASTPLTDRYIVENCRDQGTLGGNDIIEQS